MPALRRSRGPRHPRAPPAPLAFLRAAEQVRVQGDDDLGDADDYKHFLPRILELASTHEAADWPGLDLPLIAGKLQLAGCTSWPAPELAALRDFIGALRETVLADDVDDQDREAYGMLDGLTATASPSGSLIEPGNDAL